MYYDEVIDFSSLSFESKQHVKKVYGMLRSKNFRLNSKDCKVIVTYNKGKFYRNSELIKDTDLLNTLLDTSLKIEKIFHSNANVKNYKELSTKLNLAKPLCIKINNAINYLKNNNNVAIINKSSNRALICKDNNMFLITSQSKKVLSKKQVTEIFLKNYFNINDVLYMQGSNVNNFIQSNFNKVI